MVKKLIKSKKLVSRRRHTAQRRTQKQEKKSNREHGDNKKYTGYYPIGENKEPEFLFHGTSAEVARKAVEQGLEAHVGQRTIDYNKAWGDKTKEEIHKGVWLTDEVGAAVYYSTTLHYTETKDKTSAILVIDPKKLDPPKYVDYGGDFEDLNGNTRRHTEFVAPEIPPDAIVDVIYGEERGFVSEYSLRKIDEYDPDGGWLKPILEKQEEEEDYYKQIEREREEYLSEMYEDDDDW